MLEEICVDIPIDLVDNLIEKYGTFFKYNWIGLICVVYKGGIVLRLEQLHYLVEVAKHKSITAASESIHVSQPTISEALKNLEKELNAPLYVRNYYGVELTS